MSKNDEKAIALWEIMEGVRCDVNGNGKGKLNAVERIENKSATKPIIVEALRVHSTKKNANLHITVGKMTELSATLCC